MADQVTNTAPLVPQNPQDAFPKKTKMILVTNLAPSVTKNELREICTNLGTRVLDCEIVRKNGGPAGYVTFLTPKDAQYATHRLQDKLYRENLLNAQLVSPSDKPEKKKPLVKTEKPKKKVKKQVMSLRLLTPHNPPTQPPPGLQPPPTIATIVNNTIPVVNNTTPPVSPTQQQEFVSDSQEETEQETRPRGGRSDRRGGRGGRGNRYNDDNYQYNNRRGGRNRYNDDNTSTDGYPRRGGRRGRGRGNYVPVDSRYQPVDNTNKNDQPIQQTTPPPQKPNTNEPQKNTTYVPKNTQNTQNTQNNQPSTSTLNPPPSSSTAPKRNNNNQTNPSNNITTSPKIQFSQKYKPQESNNSNNQVDVVNNNNTTTNKIADEFELSLRNIRTNELRFSFLVKASDVDKLVEMYSNYKSY
jgi:hypothetical protein